MTPEDAYAADRTWFLIHLKSGKDIFVQGAAERDRIMRRKTPKAIGWKPATIHRCSICETEGPWTDDWSWYGSWAQLDDQEEIHKFCSRDCRISWSPNKPIEKAVADWRARKSLNRTHPMPEEDRRQFYRERAERKALVGAHRKFEMPKHAPIAGLKKNEGQCRWCGGRITGPYAHQRSWHRASRGERDCYMEWALHTDRDVQYDFLMARDGSGCAECPPGAGRWVDGGDYYGREARRIRWSQDLEIDHDIPLYLKPLLDDVEERRALHHPVNLRLLCPDHHREKCAREAKDRAARL